MTNLSSLIDVCTNYPAQKLEAWEAAIVVNHMGRLVRTSYEISELEMIPTLFGGYIRRLAECFEDLDAKNVAWVLNGVKNMIGIVSDRTETAIFLKQLGLRIINLQNIDLLNLSIILNSLAIISEVDGQCCPDSSVIRHLETRACFHEQSTYKSYPHALSTILNSIVRLGHLESNVFLHLSTIIKNSKMSSFSVRSLSLIAHAYSRISQSAVTDNSVHRESCEVMEIIGSGVLRISPSAFNAHDIATLSSAYARMKISVKHVFNHLLAAASSSVDESWGNQAIANTMNAFSAVGLNCSTLMMKMAAIPLRRAEMNRKILPKHLAMILNALTRLEIYDEHIFRRYSEVLLRKSLLPRSKMTTSEMATCFSAMNGTWRTRCDDTSSGEFEERSGRPQQQSEHFNGFSQWTAIEICTVAQAFAKAASHPLSQTGSWTSEFAMVPSLGHGRRPKTLSLVRVAECVLSSLAEICIRIPGGDWLGADGKGLPAASMLNALAKVGLRHDAVLQHLADSLVMSHLGDRDMSQGAAEAAGVPQPDALSPAAGTETAARSGGGRPVQDGSQWLRGAHENAAQHSAAWADFDEPGWSEGRPENLAVPRDGAIVNMAQALHALASLNYQHPGFMDAVCSLICECREEELSGQVLANVAWSLAVLDGDFSFSAAHARIVAAIRDQFDLLLQGREKSVSQSFSSVAETAQQGRRRPGPRLSRPGAEGHGLPGQGPRQSEGSRAGTDGWGAGRSAPCSVLGDRTASFVDLAEVRQVYQYLLSWELSARLGRRGVWHGVDAGRVGVARSVFQARSRNRGAASRLQREVGETLRGMGWRVAVECLEAETGYSVDMLVLVPGPPRVPATRVAAPAAGAGVDQELQHLDADSISRPERAGEARPGRDLGSGRLAGPQPALLAPKPGVVSFLFGGGGASASAAAWMSAEGEADAGPGELLSRVVCVEVDGPRHFAAPELRQPLGHTVLKRRQLRAQGARLVSIPFWEWPAGGGAGGLEQRRAYLAQRLRSAD